MNHAMIMGQGLFTDPESGQKYSLFHQGAGLIGGGWA
jgi:hypothetical protein